SVSPEGAVSYSYTTPMLIFTAIAVLSLLVAFMLKREDRRSGYGLEKPNTGG
ncbi:MAG: MFS transporter, partial [Prevotellaceae bacterium]|nr:MFS transporter [Prevotellaceae bacterium]